jgi:hypothetical protein
LFPRSRPWICNECTEKKKREEEQKKWERERLRDQIMYGKIVDFYYKSGKKYREVFFIKCKVKPSGEILQTWVEKENFVKVVYSSPVENWLEILQVAVQKEIDTKRDKDHALVDDSMGWREWKPGNKFYARDTFRFPFRLLWDDKVSKWYYES